jgi:hypothetical protein
MLIRWAAGMLRLLPRHLLATVWLLVPIGCDVVYGVSRRAEVSHLPLEHCVRFALQSIDGVANVRHEVQEGSRRITLTGLQKPEIVHYFFYEFQSLRGNLYFIQNYKDAIEFNQAYIYINEKPPQREIDLIYPLMRQIETKLEHECGLAELELNMVEYCSGVKCE